MGATLSRQVEQTVRNDVSSTKVRLFIRKGMSVKYLIPTVVIRYINHHGLYRKSDRRRDSLAQVTPSPGLGAVQDPVGAAAGAGAAARQGPPPQEASGSGSGSGSGSRSGPTATEGPPPLAMPTAAAATAAEDAERVRARERKEERARRTAGAAAGAGTTREGGLLAPPLEGGAPLSDGEGHGEDVVMKEDQETRA